MHRHGYQLVAIWDGHTYTLACDASGVDQYTQSAAPRQMLRPLTAPEAQARLNPSSTMYFTYRFKRTWGAYGVWLSAQQACTDARDRGFLAALKAFHGIERQGEQVTDFDAPFLVRLSGAGTHRILSAHSLEQARALRALYLARFPQVSGTVLMWENTRYVELP
jgi:hypothetical protein